MANPTTNYGFVLPTPTDLVTDLPADFDVALQGVDTRLKALQPGTTLGDLAYSSATANTNTRLGVGSAGQVLTVASGVPSWATPAAATSGLTLIARTTFSNVASQAFDSVFTSTYTNYLVMVDFIEAATPGDDFQMQLRYAGPTTQTSLYYGSSFSIPFSGAVANTQTNNGGAATLAAITGSTAYNGSSNIYFNSVGNSSQYPTYHGQHVDSDGNSIVFGGQVNSQRLYTGFLLKSSSSNITGAVSIYGMAKS